MELSNGILVNSKVPARVLEGNLEVGTMNYDDYYPYGMRILSICWNMSCNS